MLFSEVAYYLTKKKLFLKKKSKRNTMNKPMMYTGTVGTIQERPRDKPKQARY